MISTLWEPPIHQQQRRKIFFYRTDLTSDARARARVIIVCLLYVIWGAVNRCNGRTSVTSWLVLFFYSFFFTAPLKQNVFGMFSVIGSVYLQDKSLVSLDKFPPALPNKLLKEVFGYVVLVFLLTGSFMLSNTDNVTSAQRVSPSGLCLVVSHLLYLLPPPVFLYFQISKRHNPALCRHLSAKLHTGRKNNSFHRVVCVCV